MCKLYTPNELSAVSPTPCCRMPLQFSLSLCSVIAEYIFHNTRISWGAIFHNRYCDVLRLGWFSRRHHSRYVCAIKENGIFFLGTFLTRLSCALCMRFSRFLSCINNDGISLTKCRS